MSAVKAVLLVVVDVKDGSPTGPLVPGDVREVSVVILSVCSSNLGLVYNPLQEMEGCNRADAIISCSRGT